MNNVEAFVAVNKNRIKHYNNSNDTVYLDNGTEFQIELFNGEADTVKAEISLNGKRISNKGLVLKPGERVFLDRYLDKNKRFLFETYDVDDTSSARKAIRNNGDLMVRFFRERTQVPWITTTTETPYWVYYTCDYNNQSGIITNSASWTGCSTSTVDLNSVTSATTNLSSTTGPSININYLSTRSAKKVETGRVEEGSWSGQKLQNVNMEFESYSFAVRTIKLLPASQIPHTSDSIRTYCTECGRRLKGKWKFCPGCGNHI